MNTIATSNITSVTANQKLINETFIANAAQFGNVRAAYLPATSLFVDNENYQRKPQREINKIAQAFDDDRCGFLEVSYRKDIGMFAIIDGQNRFIAGKMAGRDRFACHILTDISVKDEAKKFAAQDENKVLVSTYDKFRAELTAEIPESMRLNRICDQYGITISRYSRPGHLRTIKAAKNILRLGSDQALRWIFDVIKESGWHTLRNAYSDALIRSLFNVYMATGIDDYDRNKHELVRYFERIDPDRLLIQSQVTFYDSGKTGALTRFLQKLVEPSKAVTFIEK